MKSQAQRAFLHAKKPGLAKVFESKTAEGAKLPKKVSQSKAPASRSSTGKGKTK